MHRPFPKVSVILPFYKAGIEFDKAVQSIAEQGFTEWELLLISNNANTEALEIARKWIQADARIKLLHEPEQGIAVALNTGLKQAKGDYIARMDADDISQVSRFEKQLAFLDNHPDTDVVSTQTKILSSLPDSRGYSLFVDWQNSIITAEQHSVLRFIESPLAHPSVMFRRNLIDKFGFYDTGNVPEDYELWLRWLHHGVKFYKIPEPLLIWTDHEKRLSRNHENYSREAFYTIKCHYLAKWIRQTVPIEKKIVVCGSSKICRKRAALLTEAGINIYGFTDVNPRRRKQADFVDYTLLSEPASWFLVNFISKRGVGESIRRHFTALGFKEGRGFILAG